MSGQLRFLLGYEQLVKNLLKSLPEDDAAAQAVGGDFERYGVLVWGCDLRRSVPT